MRSFVLGVGAQKAGTTWFFRQLLRHPNFKKPGQKELHIFDAIHTNIGRLNKRLLEERAAKLQDGKLELPIDSFDRLRTEMFLDPEQYFSYFDQLLDEEHCFTADITPSYAALPLTALEDIKTAFSKRGIKTRAFFIMREPVTRLESALRMSLRKRESLNSTPHSTIMRQLSSQSLGHDDLARASYWRTATDLVSVFGQDNVHFCFYETMFEDSEQKKLTEFFGLEQTKLRTEQKINASDKPFRYPKPFLEKLKGKYHSNYDFVESFFGFDLGYWERALEGISE